MSLIVFRMAVMNISRLPDLGYSGLDTRLEDPMDKRFRAQKYTFTDLENIKSIVLPGFAKLKAYPDPLALAELEEKYWASKELPHANQTSAQVDGAMDPRAMGMHNSMHGTSTTATAATGSSKSSTVMSGTMGGMSMTMTMSGNAENPSHNAHHGGGMSMGM
jgi:hypothetical protein